MEFKSLKNIESSFRQIRLFGIVFLSLCAVITVWSVWSSYRFAEKQREKIYVLDNGKSLMLALSQDLSQNRPAEAREHVRRFHELFFTLSPEKSAIEHNVKRALLLADKSVYNYYSDFAEKGYYNRIIAGNINQVLKVDSVVCDFNGYPAPKERAGQDGMRKRESYRALILENIEYDVLSQNVQLDKDRLDELVELMVDTVCSNREMIRVAGDDYPAEVVRSRFLKLNASHIEYVLDRMRENTTYVRNIKKYLLAALYNAPVTMDSYYTSLVSHDLYGSGDRR